MKKLNKIVLIFLFVALMTQMVGVGFHEGTHWVQGVLDDRAEPFSIKISPDCGVYHACVILKWTTDDPEERKAWNAEKSKREIGAALSNIIGTTFFIILLARPMIRRGWL